MKKILLTGASGLVGSRFLELYSKKEEILAPPRQELDIANFDQVAKFFRLHRPSAVVNFAAYTNISGGETQRGDEANDCWKVNVKGVRNLVDVIDPDKTDFIQISTDMVFSGSARDPGPYAEDHKTEKDPNRLTWYGFTKAEAERLIKDNLGGRAAILRLIYPVRAKFDKKLDYLRKPLELYGQGRLYPLFTDQQISVTFIDEACLALEKIIEGGYRGIFHASSVDTTTPYEIISYLLKKKARRVEGVVQLSSVKSVANPVRYPQFGGLKVEKTQKILGIKFSTWREVVDELIIQGLG